MDWKIDWERFFWDRLSENAKKNLLRSLPEAFHVEALKLLGYLDPSLLREIGWIEVCDGCGKSAAGRDCGCPAGTAWRAPKE
jgi:hypothetical protein